MIVHGFIVLFPFLAFAARRLLTLLHPYQQEEYDSRRFLRWLWKNRVFDRKVSGLLILNGILAGIFSFSFPAFFPILLPVFMSFPLALLLWTAWREADPRKTAKKKLVMTARAKRIYASALLLSLLMLFFFVWQIWEAPDVAVPMNVLLSALFPVQLLILIQLMPLFLVLGNALLAPFESRAQAKYRAQAVEKLGACKARIVGITGSYGKTSVKHILGHILSAAAPTLVTPGSVNTPMGVTRIIREQLTPRHQFFVVEMGAYGPGSVARLCALTPPDLAMVTAIGPAHYERFKTLEAVAQTKFELPAAAFARSGKAVIHESTLGYEASRAAFAAHRPDFIVCGEGPDAALKIGAVAPSAKGLSVDVVWKGKPYRLEAPLHGLHHGANMALAFAAACTLGVAPETAIAALKTAPQIAHRLEVKPWRSEGLLIDDAYNSNPKGFESALHLLDRLGRERGGRRILVTPGMVELGAAHDGEHARIGSLAAQKADIVLAVAAARIPSFLDAFRKEAGGDKRLIEVPDFAAAERWLAESGQETDIVLLENDLPDLFERPLRL